MIARLKQNGVLMTGGVSEADVEKAEQQLNFEFPDEYYDLLREAGALSHNGYEVLGLGVSDYLNIMVTTLEERQRCEGMLDEYVVIMKENVEDLLYIMNEDGEVFEYFSREIHPTNEKVEEFIYQKLNILL